MPVHSWTREYAWLFHDFRHGWLSELGRSLNRGVLPSGYYAMTERWIGSGFELDLPHSEEQPFFTSGERRGGEDVPFRTRKSHAAITVRRERDDCLVAVCDITSPDYGSSEVDASAVAERATELLMRGVHLLIVDACLSAAAHKGAIHAAIWNRLGFGLPISLEKPLTLAAYECDERIAAYIEPVAVGDVLPDMPLFLFPGGHVLVPLEKTYAAAWEGVPARWRNVMDAKAD